MPRQNRPLDDIVGALVGTTADGVEFRLAPDRALETSVHTTPDGRTWVAVRESPVGDTAVPTPSVLHWRLLPAAQSTWERPTKPLVPPEQLAAVQHALSLFAWPGTPEHGDLLRAVRAVLPPLHAFGAILDEAWSVLQGDREAAERFSATVQSLIATCSPAVEAASRKLCEFLDGDVSVEQLTTERPPPLSARGVPPDREALLILAAFQAADGGDTAVGARYAVVLHEQVCRYDALAALHHSAVEALGGDEAARRSLWSQLSVAGGLTPQLWPRWPGPPTSPLPHPPTPGPVGPAPPLTVPVTERRPWPPFRAFDPCVLLAAKTLRLSENRYVVTDVTPAHACPGDTITISGNGFGHAPGTVRFRRRGTATGSAPIDVAPVSWSETEVVVTVPPDAGWGVRLLIPLAAWQACGSVVELHKQGQFLADYAGGAPDVVLFSAAGVSASEGNPGACTIEPSPFQITWDVRAADHVAVEVLGPGDVRLGGKDPAVGAGTWVFDPGPVTQTTPLSVRLAAWGSCQPDTVKRIVTVTVQRTPDLSVDGMEVTQAIQHYHASEHLTDPSDVLPDNSVRLVADKPAYVRVYVRSGQDPGFDGGQVPSVTGTLQVRRFVGGTWSLVTTLSPTPTGAKVTAEADPLYAAERGTLASTLNFVVPAGHMFGHLRLSAEVTSPAAVVGGGPAARTVDVDVTLRQTLRVAGIVVGYNGPQAANVPATTPPLVLPAPSLADLLATAALLLRTFPVSDAAQFRIAGTITQTDHLADPPTTTTCTVNWDALMADVRDLADDDGNQPGWLYYGLLTNGIPMGPVVGCGGGGVGTGPVGNGPTMAEELGHALGLQHAPCGSPGFPDPSYPAYEPYDSPQAPAACIGEYGLDVAGGTAAAMIRSPWTPDFMSYCRPAWISPYHHGRLINAGLLSPVTLSPAGALVTRALDQRHRTEPQAVISLTAFLGRTGEVDSVRVRRLVTRPDHRESHPTEVIAELIDADGAVLSSAVAHDVRLRAPGFPGCPDGQRCRRTLKAYVPNVGRGARLRLRLGNDELWSRAAPAVPASVSRVEASVDEDGRLALDYQTTVARGEPWSAWVRWSGDGGDTWQPLTVSRTGRERGLDIGGLPGGELTFQVVVHDGFDSATGTSNPVSVPHKPPHVAVLNPEEGTRLGASTTLRLWGAGFDEQGNRLPDAAGQWFLDDRPLAMSMDQFVDPPPIGSHHARLVVEDGHGRRVVERSFTVVDERQV